MSAITLRPVRDSDHPWLVELHNDPVVLQNLTDPREITQESHARWWNTIDHYNERRLIAELSEPNAHPISIGFCKFSFDYSNRSVCLGADIHRDHRGRGHAHAMWIAMLRYVFDNGMHRAWLTTAEYNTVARRVYERLGFRYEGKLERSLLRDEKFYDQLIMRLFVDEWTRAEREETCSSSTSTSSKLSSCSARS